MQITATFENIQEMKDFVEAMGGRLATPQATADTGKAESAAVQASVPVQPKPATPVSVQPVPVQAVPVQQSAPVQQPVPVAQPAPAAGAVPTAAPSYTPDELARAAMTLMDSGKQGELISLLGQFGVNALPDLPPEQYGAFATALRGMGAQI